MNQAIFPLVGTAFVLLVLLPLSSLLVRATLACLRRFRVLGGLHHLGTTYALLISSSLLPLAWLFSAGVHQSEEAGLTLKCLFDHDEAATCLEPGFFALALVALAIALALPVWFRTRAPRLQASRSARLDTLIASNPALASLHARIVLTDAPGFAMATVGLFRPRVVVGADFIAALSDESLLSALAHELQHVRSHDPLRYLLLELALALNPFGTWLLRADASRWLALREAHCDREAVVRGAVPLALAEAIVSAARPPRAGLVGLVSREGKQLEFRIQLLLAFQERSPLACCPAAGSILPAQMLLIVGVALLPHQTSTWLLDLLHVGAEQALALLLH